MQGQTHRHWPWVALKQLLPPHRHADPLSLTPNLSKIYCLWQLLCRDDVWLNSYDRQHRFRSLTKVHAAGYKSILCMLKHRRPKAFTCSLSFNRDGLTFIFTLLFFFFFPALLSCLVRVVWTIQQLLGYRSILSESVNSSKLNKSKNIISFMAFHCPFESKSNQRHLKKW